MQGKERSRQDSDEIRCQHAKFVANHLQDKLPVTMAEKESLHQNTVVSESSFWLRLRRRSRRRRSCRRPATSSPWIFLLHHSFGIGCCLKLPMPLRRNSCWDVTVAPLQYCQLHGGCLAAAPLPPARRTDSQRGAVAVRP